MSEKQHAFQIMVNADVDDLEATADKAAAAVNRYFKRVDSHIGSETQVVISISGGAAGCKPMNSGSVRAIGYELPDAADESEFEFDDEEVEAPGK